jgi:hypothetical protein
MYVKPVTKEIGIVKKILLIFSLFISGVFAINNQAFGQQTPEEIFASFSSGTNAVYVYYTIDGSPIGPSTKRSILEIEASFKFPKSIAQASTLRDLPILESLCSQERDVILEEIRKKTDSRITLMSIPKSMYQLFSLLAVKKEDVQSFRIRYGKVDEREMYRFEGKRKRIDIDDVYVEERFWEVNDSIIQFIRKYKDGDISQSDCPSLKHISGILFDELSNVFSSREQDPNITTMDPIFDSRLAEGWESVREYSKGKILECLYTEIDTMVNQEFVGRYSLYRGDSKSTARIDRLGKTAFSYGDGLFSGVVTDIDAIPMLFMLKRGCCVRVDISKKEAISEQSPFYVPPLSPFEAAFAMGEHYHPRIKVLASFSKNGEEVDGKFVFDNKKERAPHLVFWRSDSQEDLLSRIDFVVSDWDTTVIRSAARFFLTFAREYGE